MTAEFVEAASTYTEGKSRNWTIPASQIPKSEISNWTAADLSFGQVQSAISDFGI